MHKKILAICAALVAFAVVPAMASASSPTLQTSAGANVGVGTELTATASNTVLTTGSGNITCQSAHMAGSVTKNSGGVIEGTITSASFTGTGTNGRCTSTISDLLGGTVTTQVTVENLHWCLKTTTADAWTIKPCSGAALGFTLHVYTHFGGANPITSCTYERSEVVGTYNTNSSPLHLTVGAGQTFTKTSGSSLCPGTGTLDATFKVQTKAGGELKVV